MKKNTLALLLSSALLMPAAAFAAGGEAGFYVGAGYSAVSVDLDGTTKDANLGAATLRGGYQLNENLAFEARVGGGVADDKIEGVKIKLEDTYGVYMKAGMPTSIGLYPYMLLGWTEAKLKASVPGDSTTDRNGDYSLGLGLDYAFTSKISAGLEYAQFYNKSDAKIDGLTLSVNYKF